MWQTGQNMTKLTNHDKSDKNGKTCQDGTNMTKFDKSERHDFSWKLAKCRKYDKTWQTWQNVRNVAKHGK